MVKLSPSIYLYLFSVSNEKILYFENFDITSVVTPINIRLYERLLKVTDYNKQKAKFWSMDSGMDFILDTEDQFTGKIT